MTPSTLDIKSLVLDPEPYISAPRCPIAHPRHPFASGTTPAPVGLEYRPGPCWLLAHTANDVNLSDFMSRSVQLSSWYLHLPGHETRGLCHLSTKRGILSNGIRQATTLGLTLVFCDGVTHRRGDYSISRCGQPASSLPATPECYLR